VVCVYAQENDGILPEMGMAAPGSVFTCVRCLKNCTFLTMVHNLREHKWKL